MKRHTWLAALTASLAICSAAVADSPVTVPPQALLPLPNTWTSNQVYSGLTSGTILDVGATYATTTGSLTGVRVNPSGISTASPNTGVLVGINSAPTIGATSSQNYTRAAGGIVGLGGSATITSGATGTITEAIGLSANITNSAAGATVTNAYGIRVATASGAGPITNAVGVAIDGQASAGTNKAALYIAGAGGVDTSPVAGTWAIDSESMNPSQILGTLAISGATSAPVLTLSGNGAASNSPYLMTGTVLTGGTGTTNFPHNFVQPSACSPTAVTTWSTAGTIWGANLCSGATSNFLDFHVNGAVSVFSVSSAGNLAVSGTTTLSSALTYGGVTLSNAVTGTGNMVLSAAPTFTGTAIFASGSVSGTWGTANTTTFQGITLKGGTSTSQNLTVESTSGAGTTDSLTLKTGSQVTAINIDTNQLITLPRISTDATHTDSTICHDTTTHALYFGSGAAGICLGISSRDSKFGIVPITASLLNSDRIPIFQWRYKPKFGDPNRLHYGPIAEDACKAYPDLCSRDTKGKVISYDWPSLMWLMLAKDRKEIAGLHAANDNLVHRLAQIEQKAR